MKQKLLFFMTFFVLLITGCTPNKNIDNSLYYKVDFYYEKQVQNSYQIKENDLVPQPEKPTKNGFVFDGWYVDYDYNTLFNFDTKITYNMTLYGRFLEIFTVTFDTYGSVEVICGNKISKPTTPTKDGYIFDGWYLNGIKFDFNTAIDKNLNLTAKWKEMDNETITVKFDSNGGNSINDVVLNVDETIVEPINPTRRGYTFNGWYLDGIKFDFSTPITKDITLKADWITNIYKVVFAETDITSDIEYGQKVSKPRDLIKDGYRFEGWKLNDALFNFDTPITSDITLYPSFIKTYTVTLESQFNNFEDLIIDENTTISSLPIPNYPGYIFKGWYLNSILFDSSSPINNNITLVAEWEETNLDNEQITITNYAGYNEGAFIEFNKVAGYLSKDNYKIYYKKSSDSKYIALDSNLIVENNTAIRADIIGISSGTYDIKICLDSIERIIPNIVVTNYDRSGYAHFNTSNNVGAYNNDGTPMNNAIIIYVTEQNKNTVTVTFGGKTYTGIGEILKNASKSSNPLIIRIVGKITAATWKPIKYSGSVVVKDSSGNKITSSLDESEIISKGVNQLNITDTITKLNGLTNKISYSSGEYDSNFNMMYVQNAKNITIEGVGANASLFQWGLCFKNCSYIEVRNLTFDDYTEDACSFEGSNTSAGSFDDFKYGHIWVHNNTFNEGINYWDVTAEQDKHEGDGATDFKGLIYITLSYNHYYKNHKTGLIGGSNSQTTASVTFHHNFYEECSSRLPLGRQANMHMYNNYYYKISGTTMSIRAGGYAFIENCVFESCNNPMTVADDSTYGSGSIKSFNNLIENCKGNNHSTVVNSRTESISNNNKFDKSFDTNPTNFYYDSINQKSLVSNMLNTSEVKQYVKTHAGALTSDFVIEETNTPNIPSTPEITADNIIILNKFSKGDISQTTTVNGITVTPKSGKTCSINECDFIIEDINITKYVSFGGGASFDTLSIQFSTTQKANITVYYSSGGSSERFVKLMTSSDSITATTPTIPSNANQIVNYTFTNVEAGNLAIGSSSSGINIYCIIIEYI